MQYLFILFLTIISFDVFAQDVLAVGQKHEGEKNYIEAEKSYRKAFFEGDPKGALYLYDLNKNGFITTDDADDMKRIGLKLLHKNAEEGDASAALDLGHYYLFGKYLKGDYKNAHRYFMLAYQRGKPMAAYRLGMSYLDGLYHNINANKAMYYMDYASNSGIGRASRQIAIAYHLGIGKSKDLDKAIEYYTKAAIEGEGLAMRDLANIYNHEIKNPTLHEKWLLEAVKFDVSDAHYMLGAFYKSLDPKKSKYHYMQAVVMKHHLSRIEIYGDY